MPKLVLFYKIIGIFSAIMNKALTILTLEKTTKYSSIRTGKVLEREIIGLSVIYYFPFHTHYASHLSSSRLRAIQASIKKVFIHKVNIVLE